MNNVWAKGIIVHGVHHYQELWYKRTSSWKVRSDYRANLVLEATAILIITPTYSSN